MSVEEYRVEMAKRTETMKKNQFVQEKKKKEMGQENIGYNFKTDFYF